MQVDPIKPTLEAPEINLLTLKYDDPLSTFAFKINLRLYIEGVPPGSALGAGDDDMEDVQMRVFLPSYPVGVARVEAVWSDGPCRGMAAGAGIPLLLLPDEERLCRLTLSSRR